MHPLVIFFHLHIVASYSQTATSVGDDSSSSRSQVLTVNNQLFLFGRELIQSESSGLAEGAAVPFGPVCLSVCLLSHLDVGQVT